MGVSVLSTDSQNSGHKPVCLLLHFCYTDYQYKGKYLDNSDKEIPWISPSWSTLRTLDKSKTRKD